MRGRIEVLTGNCMPAITPATNTCARKPAAGAQIYAYTPTMLGEPLGIYRGTRTPAAQATADDTGNYMITLPDLGRYSILIDAGRGQACMVSGATNLENCPITTIGTTLEQNFLVNHAAW